MLTALRGLIEYEHPVPKASSCWKKCFFLLTLLRVNDLAYPVTLLRDGRGL